MFAKRFSLIKRSLSSSMAQQVKNPPAFQETQEMRVQPLGWEDPLEKEMATPSGILAWKNRMNKGAWKATVHGIAESQTLLSNQVQHSTVFVVNKTVLYT